MTTTTTNPAAFDLPTLASAHWLLRLSAAATFIFHGLTKFPSLSAGAEYMGYSVAFWALIALVEVVAGVLLLAGPLVRGQLGDLASRAGGIGVAVIMVGAILTVHWGQWSAMPSETHPGGGMEFQVLLLATGLFFAARGNAA